MFQDRDEAGRRLGEALRRFKEREPILLGLARGGLPVAAAAARTLGVPFDALVVRKVKAAGEDREFGDGAVAPGGIQVGDARKEEVDRARAEMDRRIDEYLDGRAEPNVRNRFVILVDDGLATGVTALAAIRYVRTLDPAGVVIAVPVLSEAARRAVEEEADAVVFLEKPEPFHAVKDAYASFEEVTDEEVERLLARKGGS